MKNYAALPVIIGFVLHARIVLAAMSPGWVVGWGSSTALPNTGLSPYTAVTGVVSIAGQVLNDAVAVSAGSFHSLALRSNGTVVGWGWNRAGMAVGTGDEDRANGTVTIGGRVLSNVTAISAGGSYNLALRKDGTVASWGEMNRPLGLSNVIAIAAGKRTDCALALERDGTVMSFWWEKGLVPTELSNVVDIAVSGSDYWPALVLKRDSTVVTMAGESTIKEIAPPPGLSNVVAIAVGYDHYLALKNDGTVIGWGFNGHGQATGDSTGSGQSASSGLVTLGGHVLTNVVEIAASDGLSVARKRDGTVVAWGRMGTSGPATVPKGLSGVVSISAGWGFCLAVTTNSNGLSIKN